MSLPKVAVFGGSGFLGSQIVKHFPKEKYQVISLSRHLPISKVPHVQYISNVDIFKPETYRETLKDATHVVHSIGAIFPNESYKKIINARSPCQLVNGVSNFLFPTKRSGTPQKEEDLYQKFNYESLKILTDNYVSLLAEHQPHTKNPSLTYISAEETRMVKSFIPSGYITSKRQSELYVLQHENVLKPIILRPGFLYDAVSKEITPRSSVAFLLKGVNPFTSKFMCSTQSVAEAIVKSIEDQSYKGGIITLENI